MSQYRKFIVAVVGAVVAGLIAFYGKDAHVVQAAIAVLTALGVYVVPNEVQP